MSTEGENAKIKRFLLGSESATEAEEIGVRLISEPGFADKLSFAEESLIEEFLDDALTAEEKVLFERNFLTTPARAALLEETALLGRYARNHRSDAAAREQDEKKPEGFFPGLKGFWISKLLRPIAAMLVVLALGTIVWRVFLYNGGGLSQSEQEYAALNAKDLSGAPETANLSSKSLIPGTFRNADPATALSSASLTEKVLFRLGLPAETPPETLFSLELIRGGRTVFRQTSLRVYQNPNGQELKVVLPKAVLAKGAYQIKLNDGTIYAFAVE